jgi:ribosome maturation factor RimP
MSPTEHKLYDLLAPAVEACGYAAWGVEYVNEDGNVLRVYIEHENGIDVDGCAKVSRQVSAVLDVEDPISGEYSLEVSSPGMGRRLFFPEQYEGYCGATLKLTVHTPIEGQRKFTGILDSVDENELKLQHDHGVATIPLHDIEKAKIKEG